MISNKCGACHPGQSLCFLLGGFFPPCLRSFSFSTLSGVLKRQSSDPAAPEAGDRLHTAALLHDHVDVGLHDLCDLTNLETNRQNQTIKVWTIILFIR